MSMFKGLLISLTFIVGLSAFADNQEEGEGPIITEKWERVGESDTSLWRLAVPAGWLVKTGNGPYGLPGRLLFVPDEEYAWRRATSIEWEHLAIEGGNLLRIRVPDGWIVRTRETPDEATGFLAFVPDRRLAWQPSSP